METKNTKLADDLKTGLQQYPCQEKSAQLADAAFYFSYDRDPFKCWKATVDEVDIRIFYTLGPNGAYRTILLNRKDLAANRIVVAIAGGPRLTSISYDPDELKKTALFGMAGAGALVVTIDHLGTVSRSRYPEADIQPAASEIRDLIYRLRKIAGVPVVGVVASSAGALIGIQLARRERLNVLILSPPIASLEDLMAAPPGTDIRPNASQYIRHFVAIDRSG